jgi:hypothetical protein
VSEDQLREEVESLHRDLSFLARFLILSRQGHATANEHGKLRDIAERYERFSEDER